MTDANPTRSTAPARDVRRPYDAPQLVVYGSLVHLTQKTGNKSNMDGGVVNGMKNSQ